MRRILFSNIIICSHLFLLSYLSHAQLPEGIKLDERKIQEPNAAQDTIMKQLGEEWAKNSNQLLELWKTPEGKKLLLKLENLERDYQTRSQEFLKTVEDKKAEFKIQLDKKLADDAKYQGVLKKYNEASAKLRADTRLETLLGKYRKANTSKISDDELFALIRKSKDNEQLQLILSERKSMQDEIFKLLMGDLLKRTEELQKTDADLLKLSQVIKDSESQQETLITKDDKLQRIKSEIEAQEKLIKSLINK